MSVRPYVPAGTALVLLGSCLPTSVPPRTGSAQPGARPSGMGTMVPATSPAAGPDRMPPARRPGSNPVNDQTPRPLVIVDSAYLELAEASGGLVTLPDLVRSMQGSFDLFGRATTVVRLASVRLTAAGSHRVPFVVDSTMGRVAVQVKGSPDVTSTLADPSGIRITPIEWPSAAIVYVVVNPRPGPWRVEVTSAKDAPLSVEVQAMTPVNCRVTLKERTSGTNLWRDVHQRPLVGREYLLVAELREQMSPLGSVSDVELGIARPTGTITWLRTLPAPGRKWQATATFGLGDRVVVRGRLAGGEAFLRQSAAVRPVEFLLEPSEPVDPGHAKSFPLVPTRWTKVVLRATRSGGAGPVVVYAPGEAATPQDTEVRVQPDAFQLGDGQSRPVAVYLRAPRTAPVTPVESLVTLQIGRTRKDLEGNVLLLSRMVARDSDGDGLSDDSEKSDVDRDGVVDSAQAEVATFPAGLGLLGLRFEPDAVLGSLEPELVRDSELPADMVIPHGAWRIGIDPRRPSHPAQLKLFLGGVSAYRLECLLVYDPEARQWNKRGGYDASRQVLTLRLTPTERQLLEQGALAIAPAGSR